MQKRVRNFAVLAGIAALAAILLLSGLFSVPAPFSVSPQRPPLEVREAYAFATAPLQKNGAAFMNILNHSGEAEQVTGALAEGIAARVELHRNDMRGGAMQMRPIPSLDVPAGGEAVLEPSGAHVMLMGLRAPLKAGDAFDIVLKTARHGDIKVRVSIVSPGAAP